jgi:hypothetical protein
LSAVWPFCGYTYALGCAAGPDAQPDIPAATLISETQMSDRDRNVNDIMDWEFTSGSSIEGGNLPVSGHLRDRPTHPG